MVEVISIFFTSNQCLAIVIYLSNHLHRDVSLHYNNIASICGYIVMCDIKLVLIGIISIVFTYWSKYCIVLLII